MYKTIIHPTDLQKQHFSLCEAAKKIADYHKAKFYLLHVIEIPQTLILAQNLGFAELIKPAKTDAEFVLKALGEALNVPKAQQMVAIGNVKYHIIEQAQKHHCDLIIMGRHSVLAPHLLGNVTYHVMQHASCDVLTLPNQAQKATASNKARSV